MSTYHQALLPPPKTNNKERKQAKERNVAGRLAGRADDAGEVLRRAPDTARRTPSVGTASLPIENTDERTNMSTNTTAPTLLEAAERAMIVIHALLDPLTTTFDELDVRQVAAELDAAIERAGAPATAADPGHPPPGIASAREVIRLDLINAVNAVGRYDNLGPIARTSAARDLVETYVRLGGDLELDDLANEPAPTPSAMRAIVRRDDVDLISAVQRAAWQGATDAGASTAAADAAADAAGAALREVAS